MIGAGGAAMYAALFTQIGTFSLENALERFPKRHDLDLLVDRRGRMGRIQQLLLAETNRLNAFWRYLERRHKHVTDRFGSPLTQRQIILAFTRRLGMTDNQESIGRQCGIVESIGDAAERLIGFRPDDRRVGIELNIDVEMRQLEQLRGDRRPF